MTRRAQFCAAVVTASLACLAVTTSAQARPVVAGLSGRVDPPPEVQIVGLTYRVRILVRTLVRPVPRLCIDFEDDGNSWKIKMPGLRAYDDDVFCFGRFAARKRKTFTATIIPAKTGQRTLQIGIGDADVFKTANDALLDADSLVWSESFVLTG